jgi:2-polyprenyl-3-methyl-5-hydroxy-6-metoxy-1,4-benzoquinol methylase
MECPICKNTKNNLVGTKESYKQYACLQCDTVFSDPMKNPGSEWYENQAFYSIARIEDDDEHLTWNQKQFFGNEFERKGSLVDIGCGTGSFLSRARKEGLTVAGIDFSEKSLEVAKNKFKLDKLYCMSIEEFIEKRKDRFDYVTLFDVIEHLEDPLGFLIKIKSILAANGTLAIGTVNKNRKLDSLGECDMPPHHLTKWDEGSLKNLLDQAGYKIIFSKVKPLQANDIVSYIMYKFRTGLVDKMVKGNKEIGVLLKVKIQALLFIKKIIRIFIGIFICMLGVISKHVFSKRGGCVYCEGKIE